MSSPGAGVWRRFLRHRTACAAALFLIVVGITCAASLAWTGAAMRATGFDRARQPPSMAHPLGTDDLGRDLLARTLYGGTISLSLGVLAALVAVSIGTAYGLVAGFVGGRVDGAMMRIVDVLYAMPYMLLVMLLTVSLGAWLERIPLWPTADGLRPLHGEWSRFAVLALAIGSVSWLTMARVVRGQVLSLRDQPFIEAARALGLPTWRILVRHLLPNTIGPIIVFASLTVPQAILQESFLSFLGVGVQPPQATWGSLAADGIRALNPYEFAWWLILAPCAALSLTLLSLNFVGDGLRDAFDVKDRR
ncbi:MAG: ABC transporter permease [Phycisphaerales bacterium]|nr:ABC transporter permease [Phycisphaerales bacterium]